MTAALAQQANAITVDRLTVAFGGFRALDATTLAIPAGQRRAIIGPNGAGKTTLMRVVGGALPPTDGRVYLFGQDITRLPEHRRAHLGIARTYQITNLFRHLSVLDNVILALLGLSRLKWVGTRPVRAFTDVNEEAWACLAQVGLEARAHEPVNRLSYGEQRQLELALALASRPRVLLLDEPAAGLSPAERQWMAERIAQIPRDITIIMVEHNMDLVMAFAEHITVLHHGRVVADGTPEEIRANQDVRKVYLGGS